MANSPMSKVIQQLRSAAMLGDQATLTDAQLLDRFVSRVSVEKRRNPGIIQVLSTKFASKIVRSSSKKVRGSWVLPETWPVIPGYPQEIFMEDVPCDCAIKTSRVWIVPRWVGSS